MNHWFKIIILEQIYRLFQVLKLRIIKRKKSTPENLGMNPKIQVLILQIC